MSWLARIRTALPEFYPPDRPTDIVGYLRGSKSAHVWMSMDATRGRHQMLLMGSLPPNKREWDAAGVSQRADETQEITENDLKGFMIVYGGFILRPWGEIHAFDAAAADRVLDTALQSWRRNYRPPIPR